jgi:uncharacterized membrane protein
MARATNSVVVDRPAALVFAFLADGLNNPQWRDGVVSIDLVSGQAGEVGTAYRQVLKGPGGRNIDGDYRLTAVVPDDELSFVVTTGPARPTGVYRFKAMADGGTEVTFTLEYQAKGLKKLMEPMIQKAMQAEVGALQNLKRVLEAS